METNDQPKPLGGFNVSDKFGTYILYMPIVFPKISRVWLPKELEDLYPIIDAAIKEEQMYHKYEGNKYIYLSFETSYVKAGTPQKRPGWHCDGFLTDDSNYIWYSDFPTVFTRAKINVTPDHKTSIDEFNKQAGRLDQEYTLPTHVLYRLSSKVVHRAEVPERSGIRTFIKISFSKDKYNLEGNTHNPLFDYKWEMHPREKVRNCPQYAEADSVPDSFK